MTLVAKLFEEALRLGAWINPPQPVVLKPYKVGVTTGWRQYVGWVALLAFMFFCFVYGFFYALTTPFLLTQFIMLPAILVGLAIWALPTMVVAPTRTLERLFIAFFIFAIVWPNYLALALPGLPWITSVRLVGFPLVFLLLISLSVSAEFRSRTAETVKAVPRLMTLVAAFVAVQIISIPLSDRPVESLNAVIAMQISWTAIFFTAAYVFRKPGLVQLWAVILWVCAILLCFMGLWELRLTHVPWADHIPSFLAVGDEYVQRILAGARRLGTGDYRVQSVHSTSLGFAEFLALTTPFVIHFMAGSFRPWVRVAAALSLPLIFFVILSTHARLGMVGFFLAALLYLLAWSLLRWRNVKNSIFGPVIVLGYPAIFTIFLAATFMVHRLKAIVWGVGGTAYSNQGRLDQLAAGIPKVLVRPWGYGANRGAEALGYTNKAGTLTIDNYYLLVALDYGIIGFVLYYAAILTIIFFAGQAILKMQIKEREATFLVPTAIALSVFFVIKSIFSQTHNHSLQFMLMGMAAGLLFRIKQSQDVPQVEASPNPAQSIQAGIPRSPRRPAAHPAIP